MSTTTERLATGEANLNSKVDETIHAERTGTPEWHGLRLFGHGRHPDTFSGDTTVPKKL